MRFARTVRLAASAVALAVFATALTPAAEEAQAVSATDFNAGMIITDALFYDGAAMTAKEIQTFLNAKVPTCEDTDLTNDITCLKNYKTSYTARAAATLDDGTVLCKAISARSGATAAQVIDIVARACGVSQKVILVTLQKEQGLVTATDPGARRYQIAMGYGCPDGAACDAEYYGFFNQIYSAAKQFKRYQANPSKYGYQAGRVNVIKYSPTTSCGTSEVTIKNQATAGLYNYTPYRPNAAALAAGWGTGDSCSSYGNRNFFMYYSTWFGSTKGVPLDSHLTATYNAHGGLAELGAALDPAVYVKANGGGWYQRLETGTLYVTSSGIGAFRGTGLGITRAYKDAGGPAGEWGWPITDTFTFDGEPMVEFQHMRVAWVDGAAVLGFPFLDVSDNPNSSNYTALADAVWWMADQGISEGWATDEGYEFRRRQSVNRDVMAAFLYRFEESDYKPWGKQTFVDVWKGSNPFYPEIEWLATTGISKGWTTSKGVEYRPLVSNSREQMAAFLYRLAAPEGYTPPKKSPFVDVKVTDTFYTEISWLYSQGISTGWTTSAGQEFRPTRAIAREEMAAFLYRFSQLPS